jgi:hypothetical protein
MKNVKVKGRTITKDLYVKVEPTATARNTELNFSKFKEEYERDSSNLKSLNVFSGGGIGASVGLVACLASSCMGIPISSPEMITIVGGSLLFGIIAGFILY